MKKKAFLQALVLVVLLTASWFIYLDRSRPAETKPEADPPVAEAAMAAESPVETTGTQPGPEGDIPVEESVAAGTRIINAQAAPPLWKDWIDYLQQQSTPEDLRNALLAMREAVLSMDPGDGTARLIELIISGVDLDTGMAFQVGPEGNLIGAPRLQVLLADWLGQIDPERSASLARLALNGGGTQLGPDLFVVHLRNFARGTPAGGESRAYISGQFKILLAHQPWMENPTSSIAEAMDVAVYLGDPALVPPLAGLAAEGNAPRLRHASSLALERIIDQEPVPALGQLLSSPAGQAMAPATRAGFVARLDPVTEEGQALLGEYLSSANTSREEAELFLAHFPNMNQSLSHNLLSTNISNTESAGHMERLQRALDAVRSWEADPRLSTLSGPLGDAGNRLSGQLTGQPQP